MSYGDVYDLLRESGGDVTWFTPSAEKFCYFTLQERVVYDDVFPSYDRRDVSDCDPIIYQWKWRALQARSEN